MAEPEVAAVAPTAPVEEAPSAEVAAQETPTYLTIDDAKALIESTLSERESNIRKDLDAAYKTLRRGEAKGDNAQRRIDKLETELFDLSLRGLEPQQQEVAKLQRAVQQQTTAPDPNAEVAAFRAWSTSVLDEEKISADDPVLKGSFERHADGWTSAADLRVALTRAIAQVHKEREKAAKADTSKLVEKAREEERAKARNANREAEGKIDKGTAAAGGGRTRSILEMPPDEWEAFKATRRR